MDRLAQYIEEFSSAGTEADNAILTELDRATNLRIIQPKMVSGKIQGAFLTLITKMLQPQFVLEIGTFTGYSALSIAAGLGEKSEIHTIEIDDELEDIARSFFGRSPHGHKVHLHIGSALDVVPRLVRQLGRPFDMIFIDGDKREYPAYYQMVMGCGGRDQGNAGCGEKQCNVSFDDTACDKSGMPSMVRSGTIILTDNVLWYGKVIDAGATEARLSEIRPHKTRPTEICPDKTRPTEIYPDKPRPTEICPDKTRPTETGISGGGMGEGAKMDRHTAGIVEFNRMVAADPRVENVILPLRDGLNLIRVK